MRTRAVLLIVALAVGAAACGDGRPVASPADPGGGTTTTAPAPKLVGVTIVDRTSQAKVTIDARDNSFTAQYVQVKAGTPITFDNRGRNEHNVFPTEEGEFASIGTDAFQPGDAKTITLDQPGDYRYYCTLHGTKTKGMVGGIRVVK